VLKADYPAAAGRDASPGGRSDLRKSVFVGFPPVSYVSDT